MLVEVVSAGIGLLISTFFLRLLPGVAIRLFCAIGVIIAALPLLRCVGDIVFLARGFLSLVGFYLTLFLGGILGLVAASVSLSTQNGYIAMTATAGGSGIVAAIAAVAQRVAQTNVAMGAPMGLLGDGVAVAGELLLIWGVFRFQSHFYSAEMYHLYVFGAKRGKHESRGKSGTKRRRKGKKETKNVCSVCKQSVEPGEEVCKNCKTVSIWCVCCD
ncbi:hypothetical protein WA538_001473 [Blastocystis sp. DL]